MAYVKRYCNGYQFRAGNRKIWNVSGASNLEELYERTKPFVLRRLKNDVLDLPEKIITPVYMRLRSREYEDVMGEYYEWYDKGGESDSLTMQFSKIAKVRQIIANSYSVLPNCAVPCCHQCQTKHLPTQPSHH